MSLWDFSLAFYKEATVQAACLQAQDDHGADVNVLLYLLWRARAGDVLDSASIAAVDAAVAPWRQTAVEPLRAIRRTLKGPALMPDTEAQERFRNKVKALELDAERQVQALLEQQMVTREDAAAPREAAERNIAAYAGHLGTTFPRPLVAVFLERIE